MTPGRAGSTPVEVLGRMAAILRDHWAAILPAGLALFIPVGLLETVDADLQNTVGDADDVLSALEVISVALLHTAGALLGQILFAGLISALATTGSGPGIAGLVALGRELPIARLILADLALVLVVGAGFVALVLPGFLFLVWFALIGPVVEVEHAGIREAFARSRRLVRTRFWLVASFVLPITFVEGALSDAIAGASLWSLGDNFLGAWAAGAASTLVTSTALALAMTVLYLELAEAEAGAGPPSATSPPGGQAG